MFWSKKSKKGQKCAKIRFCAPKVRRELKQAVKNPVFIYEEVGFNGMRWSSSYWLQTLIEDWSWKQEWISTLWLVNRTALQRKDINACLIGNRTSVHGKKTLSIGKKIELGYVVPGVIRDSAFFLSSGSNILFGKELGWSFVISLGVVIYC